MREEFESKLSALMSLGITPAHAGRMWEQKAAWKKLEDHPRACGKNYCEGNVLSSVSGSPPRMREEYVANPQNSDELGITPAHAGRISRL